MLQRAGARAEVYTIYQLDMSRFAQFSRHYTLDLQAKSNLIPRLQVIKQNNDIDIQNYEYKLQTGLQIRVFKSSPGPYWKVSDPDLVLKSL